MNRHIALVLAIAIPYLAWVAWQTRFFTDAGSDFPAQGVVLSVQGEGEGREARVRLEQGLEISAEVPQRAAVRAGDRVTVFYVGSPFTGAKYTVLDAGDRK